MVTNDAPAASAAQAAGAFRIVETALLVTAAPDRPRLGMTA